MHYYKRNLGDYAKKAGRLSILEHGVYNLLIDACYDREKFPTEEEAIDWTWARTDEEIEAVKFVLKKFFTLENGFYVQTRIQEELDEYHAMGERNTEIARKREAKRKTHEQVVNEALTGREQVVNEASPNQEPITNNQEPITNNKNIGDKSPRPQKKSSNFDFKGELLKVGVSEKNADDWLEVRKLKKQANTDAAFRLLMSEVGKSGLSVDEAVNFAAGMSWAGFKSDWHINARASPVAGYAGVNKQEALEQRNAEAARKALEQM